MSSISPRPLDGIRVLDLSRVLAGPWAAQSLSDFGAEVIKIERLGSGDDSRVWGPPFLNLQTDQDVAAYFCSANRGKKSVALDIGYDEDRTILRRLALQADVLIENFKSGTLARYELDYASLSRLNPRLIVCSITGYGDSGPYAERAAYDAIIQGVAGIMSVTGESEGLPGAGPQKVGIPLTDILTGVYAAYGVLMALRERELSGQGQHVQLSLLDVLTTSMATLAVPFFASGVVPRRQGNSHASLVPSEVFSCQDGQILVTVGNDGQFRKLCNVLGKPSLAADKRFVCNADRVKHRDILLPMLRNVIQRMESVALVDELSRAGVPAGVINDLAQTFSDPQVKHSDVVVEFTGGNGQPLKVLGSPIKLSRTPAQYLLRPPVLGEHTEEILAQLRRDEEVDNDAATSL